MPPDLGSAAPAAEVLASAAASAMRPYPIPCRILFLPLLLASARPAVCRHASRGVLFDQPDAAECGIIPAGRSGGMAAEPGARGAICRSKRRNNRLVAMGCDFWADEPRAMRAGDRG